MATNTKLKTLKDFLDYFEKQWIRTIALKEVIKNTKSKEEDLK